MLLFLKMQILGVQSKSEKNYKVLSSDIKCKMNGLSHEFYSELYRL